LGAHEAPAAARDPAGDETAPYSSGVADVLFSGRSLQVEWGDLRPLGPYLPARCGGECFGGLSVRALWVSSSLASARPGQICKTQTLYHTHPRRHRCSPLSAIRPAPPPHPCGLRVLHSSHTGGLSLQVEHLVDPSEGDTFEGAGGGRRTGVRHSEIWRTAGGGRGREARKVRHRGHE
jgi:hypothetical protein